MIHYNLQNEFIPKISLNDNLSISILPENKENESHLTLTSQTSNYVNISSTLNINLLNHLFFGKDQLIEINNSEEERKSIKEQNNLYYIKIPENRKKTTNFKIFVVNHQQHLKKKRGRVKVINSKKHLNLNKIHDKNIIDNVLRKIQVNYMSFIILFINDILKNLGYKERFYKLDYSFKQNIKKEFIESLKTKDIGEILCNKKSKKYRKDEKSNKYIFDSIFQKKNEVNKVLMKILSENYITFFWKFYYKSCRLIDLKEYGFDKKILLSDKVKMYKDLFKENEDLEINKQYIKNLNNCAEINFKPNS